MEAKKCDRCGAFYSTSINDRVTLMQENESRELSISMEYANAYQTKRKLDLCPNCIRCLFKWIDMK